MHRSQGFFYQLRIVQELADGVFRHTMLILLEVFCRGQEIYIEQLKLLEMFENLFPPANEKMLPECFQENPNPMPRRQDREYRTD